MTAGWFRRFWTQFLRTDNVRLRIFRTVGCRYFARCSPRGCIMQQPASPRNNAGVLPACFVELSARSGMSSMPCFHQQRNLVPPPCDVEMPPHLQPAGGPQDKTGSEPSQRTPEVLPNAVTILHDPFRALMLILLCCSARALVCGSGGKCGPAARNCAEPGAAACGRVVSDKEEREISTPYVVGAARMA